MVKAMGGNVIATAGSQSKCDACLLLGADHAINYKTQDFAQEVLSITQGRGVDVILDMVAGDYVAKEIEILAEDGRLVLIAVQGGVKSQVNAGLILRKRLTLTGSTLRPRDVSFKAQIAQKLHQHIWPLLESAVIKPVLFKTFDAADPHAGAQAHALMESNEHIGKIVIHWQGEKS